MTESTAPTPHPDLKIISSRVYRGPNVWHYEPAIQLVVDLGVLEDFPTDKLPGFADALVERLPGLANHTCSRGRRGGFVERLHEGTWLGHVAEHVALQLQQTVGHDMRRGKTRQIKGEHGRYNVIYAYYDESVGLAAGELAVRLVNDLIVPDPEFDFDGATRAVHRSRRADRIRPLHSGDRRRGGQPGHPLPAAERRVAGPTRPGRPPEADPRHHDLADLLRRGRHRQQQGADPQPALGRRPAGPQVGLGPDRRGGRAAGQPDRLSGGPQAAGRQPRPRRDAGPAQRRRRARRVRRRQGGVPGRVDDRRDLCHRPRLPLPGDRRQDRGHRRAGTCARDRRRNAHGGRAGRTDQRRSAAGCRTREGADPDQDRPGGGRPGRRPGLRDGSGAAGRHHRQADPDRQHVDGRHLHRPDVRGAPGEHRDRRGSGARGRTGHRRHRLHRP